jgi:hypothetical protein
MSYEFLSVLISTSFLILFYEKRDLFHKYLIDTETADARQINTDKRR